MISPRQLVLNSDPFRREVKTTLSTPSLHYSARYNILPLLKYALDSGGGNVDPQDSLGRTPLMMAITGRHEKPIELLLSAGADVFLRNKERTSALQMFVADYKFTPELCQTFLREFRKRCSSGEEAARLLIDAGCQPYRAAYLKDAKILEYMLERGLPRDSVDPLNERTVLHIAVMLADVESVKLLLRYGADAEAVDAEGRTPLNYLYRYDIEQSSEKMEILRILLKLEVSATSCTSEGFFLVEGTLAYGNGEAVGLVLKDENVNLAAKDNYDERSILHYLAVNTNPEVIEVLRAHIHKFDVNVVDKSGVNPLYCAIVNGNYRMVEFFLEQGTKPHFASSIGYCTPLYYAYKRSKKGSEDRYDKCAELLLQHNADPQFIIQKAGREKMTIFDIVPDKSEEAVSLDRMKPVIAQLAVLESRGTPIAKVLRSKINSQRSSRKYLDRCRRVLGKEISESVTVLKLLTTDEKKMAKYLNKKELVLKLKRLGYKRKVGSSYSYYYNTLKKHFSRGMTRKTLRDKAAKVVCKLFKGRVDKTNIITENVIDYLNDQDLRQLHQFDLKATR